MSGNSGAQKSSRKVWEVPPKQEDPVSKNVVLFSEGSTPANNIDYSYNLEQNPFIQADRRRKMEQLEYQE